MWQATQNQKLLVLKLVQIARHDSTRTNTIVRFHGGRREPWSSGHGRGFESRRHILDGNNIFSNIFFVRIVMFV